LSFGHYQECPKDDGPSTCGAEPGDFDVGLFPKKFCKEPPIFFKDCPRSPFVNIEPARTAAEAAARTVYSIPFPEIIILLFKFTIKEKIKCLDKYNAEPTRV
jgi:hypothetical protein